ncbi:hypothetical protein [Candidatus Mycoplasma haematohominis]|uniref:hypothetical protein n=1 Tax=Candidatus Mycoplasma haematohominis TaxID=1494318 RepID=UPI001C0A68D4|nr:hypothetical protein [Candidatus Mycoplasma haemohominis]
MFNWISGSLALFTLAALGLGGGYFGTKEYYEGHPQTLAQSKELTDTNSIASSHKDSLLAINPKENKLSWKIKEKDFKEKTKNSGSDTPASTIFKQLKTDLTSRDEKSLTGDLMKKACEDSYKTSSSASEQSNISTDMQKYCKVGLIAA